MANAGAFKKGEKKPNQGKRGPSKTTVEFRQTVQKVLDENVENVGKWLAAVAHEDPARALDLLAKLAEFAAPKLGRTEHVGKDGGPIEIVSKEQRDAAVLAALRADA